MKNSKVTSVQSNGSWEGKYGIMYKFEIGFENGDVGEYSSKNQEQNKFVIDDKIIHFESSHISKKCLIFRLEKLKNLSNFFKKINTVNKFNKVKKFIKVCDDKLEL